MQFAKAPSHLPLELSPEFWNTQSSNAFFPRHAEKTSHKVLVKISNIVQMMLLRMAIGTELRAARVAQNRTLRQVARTARVSLGYLSEVERGQKEASSELLASICTALDINLSSLLRDVSSSLAAHEVVKLQVVDAA